MYLDGNLVWKFSLKIQYGNLVWKLLMEIQFGKLVEILDRNLHRIFYPWKLVYKFTSEIQIEIQFGNFDPWKFSMQIQFGNLDGNLVWKFGSLKIWILGNLVSKFRKAHLVWK